MSRSLADVLFSLQAENINCSIGSISQHCLNASMAREGREGAKRDLVKSVGTAKEDHGCWMTQFYQGSSPDEDVLETLVENLKDNGIDCTIQEDVICCEWS